MIKWINENTRKAIIFSMIIFSFMISVVGVKDEILKIHNYYSFHNDEVEEICENFPTKYNMYMSRKIGDKGFSYAIDFVKSNADIINKIIEFKDKNFKEPNDIEVKKICTQYYVQVWLAPSLDAFDIKKYNKSIDYLSFYKLKIIVNISVSILAMALLCLIFINIKKNSEGIFRISVLSIFPIAAIPYFIPSYSSIATPETQSITFNACIFLLMFLLIKIFNWVRDGFNK